MAKFQKGKSGNPQGKKPGTPNQVTKKIREKIQLIIDEHFQLDDIKKDLEKLEPKDRLTFLDKLLRHVLPPPPPENMLDGMSDTDLDKLIIYLKNELSK